MKIFFILVLLFSAFYMPAAWAQCTTGVDTGGQCIPPNALEPLGDSDQHAQSQQSQAVWATRWGAIAEDPQASAAGTAVEQESKSKAESEALARCTEHGGKSCSITLTYYNQCAAVAVNKKNMAVRTRAPTIAQAEHLALTGFGHGDTSKIVYSACSLPIRVQ